MHVGQALIPTAHIPPWSGEERGGKGRGGEGRESTGVKRVEPPHSNGRSLLRGPETATRRPRHRASGCLGSPQTPTPTTESSGHRPSSYPPGAVPKDGQAARSPVAGTVMERRWVSDGSAMGQRWKKDGPAMEKRWEKDGNKKYYFLIRNNISYFHLFPIFFPSLAHLFSIADPSLTHR
jgi:hypothetical protein